MTQSDFVGKYRHELDGIMLDAALSNRSGSELSIWLRSMRGRIERVLTMMHDDLTKPASNGAAQPVKGQDERTTRTGK